MISSFCLTLILLHISGCYAAGFLGLSKNPDIDELDYKGEAFEFCCFFNDNPGKQPQPSCFNVTGRADYPVLQTHSLRLNNGNEFILFYDEIGESLAQRSIYAESEEKWAVQSESNICWIRYGPSQLLLHQGHTVTTGEFLTGIKSERNTRRFTYGAKLGSDMMIHAVDNCDNGDNCLTFKKITGVGFGFGGHMMAKSLQISAKKKKQSVKKFLGLDPIGVPHIFSACHYIKKGIADDVEVWHADYNTLLIFHRGTKFACGHTDFYITKQIGMDRHFFAIELHKRIAMKRLAVIAKKNADPLIVTSPDLNTLNTLDNQCMMGLYGEQKSGCRGKIYISLEGNEATIQNSLEEGLRSNSIPYYGRIK